MSDTAPPNRSSAGRSIRRHLLAGLAAAIVLVGGVGGWAATTELSGAVIADGHVIVDSSVKKVQHPTGGVVGELRVRDGDHVKTGNILLRLDETQTRANLAIIIRNLDELAARRARDEAERDGRDAIAFPADLLDRRSEAAVAALLAGEQNLFELRRNGRNGQKAQLREQVSQLEEEIRGLGAQEAAKVQEIRWNKEELDGVRDLWRKNLVQITRVTALERDAARLEGERGALIASRAQARARIAETNLKIMQVDEDLRTEVGKELADIRGKMSELAEKRIAAEDQLKRIDLRAPQDGVVHQLSVHTIGGVVSPGEAVMLIVPEGDLLTVEARVQPRDIDQVHLGQAALLRFTGLSQRTTPEIDGTITLVSAETTQDDKTGVSYYTIRASLADAEMARLGAVKLIPGMPVETFVQTMPRTVLSFLVKPLRDQVEKAFRER